LTSGAGPHRILVVRLGAMGDVLHAMPAVAAIREALPGAHIGWVIENRWTELLCAPESPLSGSLTPARPLIDTVHRVDTLSWRKSLTSTTTWRDIRESISAIRKEHYEVALDVQGAIKSAVLARLSGAAERVGSAAPRESAAKLFYTKEILTRSAHVVDQALELAGSVCGSTLAGVPMALPIHEGSEHWADAQVQQHGRFAILNPGAGWGAKLWPSERYAAVAGALAARGIATLINFGPGEEKIADDVVRASGGCAIPVPCTISQLIALTRRASLFVGGDTGPMHLAAALQVPVVALFGPTNPARNGPYGNRARVLRSADSATNYSHVHELDPGLMAITAEEVICAAMELLEY
jgi:heptosyltransferase I